MQINLRPCGGYGFFLLRRDSRDLICPSTGLFVPPRDFYYIDLCLSSVCLVNIMPRLRKDCPLCGKQGLLKLSRKDKQRYLRQAKVLPLDRILKELMTLYQSGRITK